MPILELVHAQDDVNPNMLRMLEGLDAAKLVQLKLRVEFSWKTELLTTILARLDMILL